MSLVEWQGHKWRKVTRVRDRSHWHCKQCGLKTSRDSRTLDLPITLNSLDMRDRFLSCNDIIVRDVMES